MARRLGSILLLAIMAALPIRAYAVEPTDKELEQRRKAIDDDYKAAVDRAKVTTPGRTVDPWGSVRDSGAAPKKPDPLGGGGKPAHP
jgi:hypothetical protein